MTDYSRPHDASAFERVSHRLSAWREQGVPAYELRRDCWERSYRGVARPAGLAMPDSLRRIHDAAALLPPDGAVGGWAAAFVQGVRYFDGLDRRRRPRPVLLFTPDDHQLRRRAGIRPCEALLREDEVVTYGDLRLTSLPRVAFDEMAHAPTLTEAVVAGDMLVSVLTRGARTSTDLVRLALLRHPGARGIVQARRALELCSIRSMSPWETRTRVVAADGPGLSRLLVNVPVFGPDGRLLGIPDLLDPASGLVIESDGEQHRQADQHSADNVREELFEDHGLTVVRVTSGDHLDEAALVGRLRAGHVRARRRHPGCDRWTLALPGWWAGSALSRRWRWP